MKRQKKAMWSKAVAIAVLISLCIPTVYTAQKKPIVAEAATPAPSGISIVAENGSATITWEPVSGATTYALFMKDKDGNVTLVHNRISGTTYSFSGLKDNARYGFVLKAYTREGWSGYSTTNWVTCNLVTKAPETVTVTPGDGEVTVSWTPSYAAQTYAVFLKDTSGNVTLVHNRVNGTSYTIKGLKNNVRMGFVVKAYVNRQWSTWSKVAWATPTEASKVPQNLQAEATSGNVLLSWDAVPQAEKYAVYQKSKSGVVTLLSSNVKGNRFEITGLQENETVGFTVKAYVIETWSDYSTVLWVTIPKSEQPATDVSLLRYEIDEETDTVQITGVKDRTLTEIVFPGYIEGKKVTRIRDYAFQGNTNLTSITIPEEVTGIGECTFLDCSSLTDVKIKGRLTEIYSASFMGTPWMDKQLETQGVAIANGIVFASSDTATKVIIPNGVTEIADYAFGSQSNLVSVTIPEGVTSIGKYAFRKCNNLSEIIIPESITDVGDYAFVNTLWLENQKEKNGIVIVADKVIAASSTLTNVVIPEEVTCIGIEAFADCTSLTNVTIPDSVIGIEDKAFEDCESLTAVTIPKNVTNMGEWVFSGCSDLASVTISEGVTSIGYGTFSLCESLTQVTIPDSVTSLGSWAFFGCDSLSKVKISKNINSIGENTFNGCESLTEISIPESVTSIGEKAFYACKKMTSVTIPSSVTSIGEYVFKNCSSDLVMKVKKDSVGHNYAISNGVTYELY